MRERLRVRASYSGFTSLARGLQTRHRVQFVGILAKIEALTRYERREIDSSSGAHVSAHISNLHVDC